MCRRAPDTDGGIQLIFRETRGAAPSEVGRKSGVHGAVSVFTFQSVAVKLFEPQIFLLQPAYGCVVLFQSFIVVEFAVFIGYEIVELKIVGWIYRGAD